MRLSKHRDSLLAEKKTPFRAYLKYRLADLFIIFPPLQYSDLSDSPLSHLYLGDDE